MSNQQKRQEGVFMANHIIVVRVGKNVSGLPNSDWDDERIATQRKPNQGSIAGIKILTLNL
jgi:hypothetical protein